MSLLGKTPPRPPEKPPKKQSTDLFSWIGALYSKKQPEGTPPTFMMHRFLASDRDLAIAARYLQDEVREPALIFKTWQAMLPGGRPPQFGYIAPRKRADEEELVTRMKGVLSESRRVVETMVSIVQLAGRESELFHEFGFVTELEEKNHKPKKPVKAEAPKPQQGLLAGLKR